MSDDLFVPVAHGGGMADTAIDYLASWGNPITSVIWPTAERWGKAAIGVFVVYFLVFVVYFAGGRFLGAIGMIPGFQTLGNWVHRYSGMTDTRLPAYALDYMNSGGNQRFLGGRDDTGAADIQTMDERSGRVLSDERGGPLAGVEGF